MDTLGTRKNGIRKIEAYGDLKTATALFVAFILLVTHIPCPDMKCTVARHEI